MEDNSTKNLKKLFLIFKDAIDGERKAQVLYQKAIRLCEDEFLKKILESFYQDECRHEQELMDRYNKIRTEYNFDE